MRVVMDQNIRAAGRVFDRHGDVLRMDGRDIGPGDVRDADALIVRSVTRVDGHLLEGSRVRFVGSTTIGTDHLDTGWLESSGIRWASAPGCNADAAAQYSLAMIWLACRRLDRDPFRLSYGIIGRGNVGSRLLRLLQAMGVDVVANDPPLAERGTQGLVSLEQALARDVVSLHVPLTTGGDWPTLRMIDTRRLALLPRGALLVNAARGDVADGAALLEALRDQRVHAALDVWPGEPRIDPELLQATTVATPHVAGYSDDGRRNGAMMIYRAFCDWCGDRPGEAEIPSVAAPHMELKSGPGARQLDDVLERCCFVARHDQAMRRLQHLPGLQRGQAFDRLRREYPSRRDFQAWRISGGGLELRRLCRNLGFSLESSGN